MEEKSLRGLEPMRPELKMKELVFVFGGRVHTCVVKRWHSEDRAHAGGLRDLMVGRERHTGLMASFRL